MSSFSKILEKEIADCRRLNYTNHDIIGLLKAVGFNIALAYLKDPELYKSFKDNILLINNFCEQIGRGEK